MPPICKVMISLCHCVFISVTGIEPFEGDMTLDSLDKKTIEGNANKAEEKRNVQMWAQKLWITRVVPYEIDGSRGRQLVLAIFYSDKSSSNFSSPIWHGSLH